MSYRSEMLVFAAATSAGLLVATGVGKLWRPHDTARAIRQLGLPVPVGAVRLLAAAEVLVGGAVVVSMSTVFILAQCLLYLSFTVWTLAALRSEVPISSCGCLGRDDTPPYFGHLAVNLIGVVISGAAVLAAPSWAGLGVLEGAAAALLIATGVWLSWMVLGIGAQTASLVRG